MNVHLVWFRWRRYKPRSTASKEERPETKKGSEPEGFLESDDETKSMTKGSFNEIIKQENMVPFKKADASRPENNRPSCALFRVYKVFATLLYERLYSDRSRLQALLPDHRPPGCWNKEVESGESACGWRRSTSQRRSTRYVMMRYGNPCRTCLLKNQKLEPDKESDDFPIARGSKQGNPWSSQLFNSVLQVALQDDLRTWRKKRVGITYEEDHRHCISNLKFAEDVLLQSTSLDQLKKMLTDFKKKVPRKWD